MRTHALLAPIAAAAFSPFSSSPLAAEERIKPLGDIPVFHEEAAAAGLNSVYDGPWEFFVGGGGAALDCDGSGFPSVFLAGGLGPPSSSSINRSQAARCGSRRSRSTSAPIPSCSRMSSAPIQSRAHRRQRPWASCSCCGSDGISCSKAAPTAPCVGQQKEWNFDGDQGWTTSFAAIWEKGEKFPTFAVGHYVDRDAPGSPWGTCQDNSLFRPQPGDKPDYSVRTPLAPGYCALSMLFTDWNRSGTPSLRVSNDRQYYRGGEEQMWRIVPGATPRLYGPADGWRHVTIFGMGIAEGDIDGSGYPQYALTSMGDIKLQKLDRDESDGALPVYHDIAGDMGATAHFPYTGGDKRPSTSWHAEFADFNNASLLDLFIAKGNLSEMPDFAAFDPNNLLLGQWNGKFAEAGDLAGIALNRIGRGALIDDFNLDGKVDILVINRTQPATLFRNLGADDGAGGVRPMGNWSEIRLIEPNPNRSTRSGRKSRSKSERAFSIAPSQGIPAAATRRVTLAGPRGPRHVRNGARRWRSVAGRGMELHLPGVRQPVRGHRPRQAAGGLLVSGAVEEEASVNVSSGPSTGPATPRACASRMKTRRRRRR